MSRPRIRVRPTAGLLLLTVGCGPTLALPSADGSSGSSTGTQAMGESTTETPPPPQPTPPDPAPPNPTPPPPDPTTGGAESSGGSSTGSTEPPIWEDVPPWELPEECAWLEKEQAYCLLVMSESTTLYGVDSGQECDIGDPQVSTTSLGMAWIGMSTASCGQDEEGNASVRVTRLDTGESASIPKSCSSVTSERDVLFVGTDPWANDEAEPFREYTSYEGVANETPDREFALNAGIHRIAVADAIVWRAWHSTDELERFSLAQDDQLPELPIPEHDDWVHGFSIVNDIALVGNHTSNGSTLSLFDTSSGALLEQREFAADRTIYQLNCRSTVD